MDLHFRFRFSVNPDKKYRACSGSDELSNCERYEIFHYLLILFIDFVRLKVFQD